MSKPVYLDCCATTPLEDRVKEILIHYLTDDFGNEGSRTHEYGTRAKQAVQKARDQVAAVVKAQRDEVIFTSGATESNNIALLGLAKEAQKKGKTHIISSKLEHKAVIEPLEYLERNGFTVSWVEIDESGRISPERIKQELRDETFLISVIQANNETGIVQPIGEIAKILENHETYFHCDAAQGFGKEIKELQNPRIDLISVSGHKIYGPKGIGALIARRRGYRRAPLQPLLFGGGQERGLRPGTLSVPLIAALGQAAEMALSENETRRNRCMEIKEQAMQALGPLSPKFSGNQQFAMPHVLNFSVGDIDSEALIVSLKDLIAFSNGSACTSSSYSSSHVLKAMGMSDDEANACVRISWCHLTPDIDWSAVANRIKQMI